MEDIWIGSHFKDPSNGILVLGESTYGDDLPLEEYIPQWISGAKDRTFNRICKAFSADQGSKMSVGKYRQEFWSRIAYFNFVQGSVGPNRSDRPTPELYQVATARLPQLLQLIAPRGVLILGKEQAYYSVPVMKQLNLPYVVVQHPTAYGVQTSELSAGWGEIQSKKLQT